VDFLLGRFVKIAEDTVSCLTRPGRIVRELEVSEDWVG
jgi:hypothetical protein